MKPAPAPEVAGNTSWERLDSAARKVFIVSRESVIEAEEKRKRTKARKQRKVKDA